MGIVKPEYVGVSRISGPIIVIEGVTEVGFDEMVEIVTPLRRD